MIFLRESLCPSWLTGLLRGKRVHFVEDAQSLEHNSADNLQAARAQLVDRIFRRMPVSDVVAVAEVNQVHGWNTSLHKRNVVIGDFQFAAEKM